MRIAVSIRLVPNRRSCAIATSWPSILIPQLRGRRWDWCGRGCWIWVSNPIWRGVDTAPDVFYKPTAASVTFTSVHRAKGNEAAMVYIINVEDCQSAVFDLARIRSRLFTAITRSKAWVRVLGVGRRMKELKREYKALKARQFVLSFRYPSAEERTRLRVIHRDMTQRERKRVEGRNRSLNNLIQDIERGDVHVEDLDDAVLNKLETLLQRRSR